MITLLLIFHIQLGTIELPAALHQPRDYTGLMQQGSGLPLEENEV